MAFSKIIPILKNLLLVLVFPILVTLAGTWVYNKYWGKCKITYEISSTPVDADSTSLEMVLITIKNISDISAKNFDVEVHHSGKLISYIFSDSHMRPDSIFTKKNILIGSNIKLLNPDETFSIIMNLVNFEDENKISFNLRGDQVTVIENKKNSSVERLIFPIALFLASLTLIVVLYNPLKVSYSFSNLFAKKLNIAEDRNGMWQQWVNSANKAKSSISAITFSVGPYPNDKKEEEICTEYFNIISNLKKESHEVNIRLLAPAHTHPEKMNALIRRKLVGFDVRLNNKLSDNMNLRYQVVDDTFIVLNLPNNSGLGQKSINSVLLNNEVIAQKFRMEFDTLWCKSIPLYDHILYKIILEHLDGQELTLSEMQRRARIHDDEEFNKIIDFGLDKQVLLKTQTGKLKKNSRPQNYN